MTEHPSEPTRRRLAHGIRPMTGRDPDEAQRVSTPLELFFDLTFAISFGVAGNEAARLAAENHVAAALMGFAFAMFAVVWAWINFTWFASAFDTDDWLFRVLTMVQMVGVLILAIGLPRMFHSMDQGTTLANGTMVLGYVVMRVALVIQWLRAGRQCAGSLRTTCLRFAVGVTIAQVGWVAFYFAHLRGWSALTIWLLLLGVELAVPAYAERAGHTPWHAHHIAERYGLMAIIALGECLIGTVATLSASIEQGWTLDAALVGLAGTGLAFALWWTYFLLRGGEVLARQRSKAFGFGYGHIAVFASIAAIGAGLHVAADAIGGDARLPNVGVVLCIAAPVAAYSLALGGLYAYVMGPDRLHVILKVVDLAILAAAVALAASGAAIVVCLLVVMLAPLPAIVSDEWALPRRPIARRLHLAARAPRGG